MSDFGLDLVLWLQVNLTMLTPLMRALSFLGTTEFLLLLGLTVYWCVDARTGARLGLLLITGAALGGLLKLAFHMPRPYWFDARVQPLAAETGYGMPSLHTLAAWAVAPWLGYRLGGRVGALGGALLAAGISLSRIHLGAHFPGDVAAGCVIGLLVWVIVEAGLRYFGPILMRAGFAIQCLAAAAASAAVWVSQSIILGQLKAVADPDLWAANAARINTILPRDPAPIISLAGLILGTGIGLASRNRWARFDARGNVEKRILRLLFGFAIALFFLGGSAVLCDGLRAPLGPALLYLRYGLTGWWLIFLAPWCFLRLGLAGAEHSG